MPPAVTLVIPVLFDADAASALLQQVRRTPDIEVVVVDGAEDVRLRSVVRAEPGVTLLHARAGRASQMNAGAARASGTWLVFLHADSSLDPGWLAALKALEEDVVGGWFQFALDDPAWQARVIEKLTAWRVKTFRLPYGDQGLFVRRSTFYELGGFREWPIMEDVDFARRLVSGGRTVALPLPLRTSSRRWRRDGWFLRSGMNLALVGLYFLGVSPARLARWYPPASTKAPGNADRSARRG